MLQSLTALNHLATLAKSEQNTKDTKVVTESLQLSYAFVSDQ